MGSRVFQRLANLQAADLLAGTFSRLLNGPSLDTTPQGKFVKEVFRLLGFPNGDAGRDHVFRIDFRDAKRRPSLLTGEVLQENFQRGRVGLGWKVF